MSFGVPPYVDTPRSLPSFKVLSVPFLGEVSSDFLPSKKACWAHRFRYWGVGQQYPSVLSAQFFTLDLLFRRAIGVRE
jgi:hypothetical protein